MAKEIEIKKREEFRGDFIAFIKEGYIKRCREKGDSPSVVGMLEFLESEKLIDEGGVLRKLFSHRLEIKGKPVEVVKQMSLRYGIKRRTLWNYWDYTKVR